MIQPRTIIEKKGFVCNVPEFRNVTGLQTTRTSTVKDMLILLLSIL